VAAVQGAARSARLVVTPSPVGAHARTHAERAAGHCLGEWFTARSRAVELRRTSEDRVLAVAATRRLSAERVAGDVQEHAIGDREPHSASSGASWKSLRSTVIDDHPGVGPVTALATEVFLGDPQRFTDSKTLAS